MRSRDIVVIGASTGGVEALRQLIAGLPKDFPAALLVVLHMPSGTRSALPNILARAGQLSVKQAEEGDPVRPGHVLVAGPDHHLIVHDGTVGVSRGPTENGHRPAIDVLFRSAAQISGPRVIGVVLSGALDDGTAGLAAIRSRGGVGVVQNPAEAMHPSMPRSAIEGAAPEHVVSVSEMPALLQRLAEEEVDDTKAPPTSRLMAEEIALSSMQGRAFDSLERPGQPSTFTCPDCDGNLALIEERAVLTNDMSRRATERGHRRTAEMFDAQASEARRAARLVRDLLTTTDIPLAGPDERTGDEQA